MRAAIISLFLTVPAGAETFDSTIAIRTYNALYGECQIGETDGGTQLTPEQSSAACGRLKQISADLTKNGYCWDKSEVEWVAPGQVDTTGKVCK